MSVFLDANILFSASNTTSQLHRLLAWLHDKETLVTSQYAATEAERNIMAKRPQWAHGYERIRAWVALVPEAPLHSDAGLPDKDAPILGAAIAAQCEYLVTGDKRDFGHLYNMTIEHVTVLDVLTFAGIVTQRHT